MATLSAARRLAAAAASASVIVGSRVALSEVHISHRDGEEPIKRRESDPEPPDGATARRLVEAWTKEEESPGYRLPSTSWPTSTSGLTRRDIPVYREGLAACGGADHLREGPRTAPCNEVTFKLAMSLLGGTLCGHVSNEEERSEEEIAEGTDLMRQLADAGSIEGSCGWAFILHNGDYVEEDVERAAQYHRQAAGAGYAQSMHELGTMHYLGDGLPEDLCKAAFWYRRAAELGQPAAMYMLGELLLAGEGTPKDVKSAIGWFAAAGELGHRGARSRVISALGVPDGGQYHAVAALRLSKWTQMV